MILLSKILKAGAVTFLKEKLLYTDVIRSAVEEDNDDEDDGSEIEDDFEEPVKETPEQQEERILAQAREKAEGIIKDAKKKAEKEAESITNKAWEQGHKEGMDLASSEGDAIRAQAQKVLLEAQNERKKILNGIEAEVIDLIIKITRKLLDDSFQVNPKIISLLIKKGLTGTNLTGDIFVHVSPADYEATVESKSDLMTVADSSTRLEIVKDQSLNPKDCVIETPFGSVDCSLNAGFEALTQNLKFILNGNKA